VHCYRTVEDREELSTAEIRRVLRELADAGVFYLTFSGGEIFLRRDLFEIIEYAKSLNFDVRLKTNALLVTEAHARRVRELGVHQVTVSIYSADPDVHDRFTKVPGSLEKTIAGVTAMRAAGLRVRLTCPVMSINVASYHDIQALAERLGTTCNFDPMITAKNDGDTSPTLLRIGRADLRRVLSDPSLRPPPSPCTPLPSAGPRDDLDTYPCSAGHSFCYISPYGDVMPCVAMPIVCGNVRETPFAAIWSGAPRMLDVRRIRIRDLHTCRSCEVSSLCTRCPGQAFVEHGDIRGPSHASCEHTAVAAEVAGITAVPASWRSASSA
jgi:radical SAM protein with 4Fe4S-binding SPASM domain